MVYTECTETAAVSSGTSHVTTKQHCKYITSVNIKSCRHSFRITRDNSAVSLLESGEQHYIEAIIINNNKWSLTSCHGARSHQDKPPPS